VFVTCQQILDALWDQRAERDLVRPWRDVDVVPPVTRVQIDPVAANANRIGKLLSALQIAPCFDAYMLLQNGELRPETPALTHIGILGKSVERSGNVRAQRQAGIPLTTVGARRFGLHPIQQRETELARASPVLLRFFLGDTY